jgi:hypothetical protein
MFTFLLLALVSCKKSTLVTIQAQDYLTGDGSAYAGMEYAVAETWTPYLETKSKIVKTGFLDENGYASFDLKMKNNRSYILGVSQPENMCYGGLQQHYLDHEKNNAITFEYAHCAYSKLILNNASCIGPEDKLILYQTDDLENIDDTFGWEHNGCVHWETAGGTDGAPIGYSRINYGNIYYKWEVTKSGVTSTYYDTVYYPATEFITYQIDY